MQIIYAFRCQPETQNLPPFDAMILDIPSSIKLRIFLNANMAYQDDCATQK